MRLSLLLQKTLIAPPRWLGLMFLCLLGCVIFVRDGGDGNVNSVDMFIHQAQTIFPDADSVTADPSGQSFLVWDRHEQRLGKIIHSSDLSPDYVGYGGVIPVCIVLDQKDNIIALHLGRNHETPRYLTYIKKHRFLNRWQGLKATEAVERQVDAISGATMSCMAISKTVRHSLSIAYDVPLPADLRLPEYHAAFSFKRLLLYAAMLGCLLYVIKPSYIKIHRRLLLLLSVVILGILNGMLLSLAQVRTWLISGIAFPEHLPLACLAGIAVFMPLLKKKNIYCAYLCPFGAAQELLGQGTCTKHPMPKKIANLLFACGSVLLIFVGFTLLAGIDFDLSLVEPFSVFSIQTITSWVLLLAGICLLTSVYYPRCWCRFLCPIGRIINLFQWGILTTRNKRRSKLSMAKRPVGYLSLEKIG